MQLTASAHVDTFCRDNLPPPDAWPELLLDLPGLHYPERLNCAGALLDDVVAEHGPDRPCLRTDEGTWTYGELLARAVLKQQHGLLLRLRLEDIKLGPDPEQHGMVFQGTLQLMPELPVRPSN